MYEKNLSLVLKIYILMILWSQLCLDSYLRDLVVKRVPNTWVPGTYVPGINPRNWYLDPLLLTIVLTKQSQYRIECYPQLIIFCLSFPYREMVIYERPSRNHYLALINL